MLVKIITPMKDKTDKNKNIILIIIFLFLRLIFLVLLTEWQNNSTPGIKVHTKKKELIIASLMANIEFILVNNNNII